MEFGELKLLPRHGINLHAYSEKAQQFVIRFRHAWKQVPIAARRKILAHWRGSGMPVLIEFSDVWNGSDESFAQVKRCGTIMKFSASAFAMLPPSIAHWIIGHELAHVFQKACGKRPGGEGRVENEQDADRIATSWGFDKTHRIMLRIFMEEGRKLSFEQACAEILKMDQTKVG